MCVHVKLCVMNILLFHYLLLSRCVLSSCPYMHIGLMILRYVARVLEPFIVALVSIIMIVANDVSLADVNHVMYGQSVQSSQLTSITKGVNSAQNLSYKFHISPFSVAPFRFMSFYPLKLRISGSSATKVCGGDPVLAIKFIAFYPY